MGAFDEPYYSEDEEDCCPICIEEMDISDRSYKPCPCGFQICQFCYNSIKNAVEPHNRCPSCRRTYDEASVEYKQLTPEDIKREQERKHRKEIEKKQRERERSKEQSMSDFQNKKNLSTIRVIQKNLVYVIGLNPSIPSDDLQQMLRKDEYFGQYGKIQKIVINRRVNAHGIPGIGVYVTFARKEDAARCIAAVDGSINDGKQLRAAYGTTKYCSNYLRGQSCPNVNCMYLHEPGEEVNTFNKKDHLLPHPSSAQSTPSRPNTAGSNSSTISSLPGSGLNGPNFPGPSTPTSAAGSATASTAASASTSTSHTQPHAHILPTNQRASSVVPNVPSSASSSVAPSPSLAQASLPPSIPPWSKATTSPLPHIQKISESDLPDTSKDVVNILDSCIASLAAKNWNLNFYSDVLTDEMKYPVMFSLPMKDEARIKVFESALARLDNLDQNRDITKDLNRDPKDPKDSKESKDPKETSKDPKETSKETSKDPSNSRVIGLKDLINADRNLSRDPIRMETRQEVQHKEPKKLTNSDIKSAMKSFSLETDDSEFMETIRKVGTEILQPPAEIPEPTSPIFTRTSELVDNNQKFEVHNLPDVKLVGDDENSVWSAIARYNNLKLDLETRVQEFNTAKQLTKKRMKRMK